jgi:hypothetical protein
VTGPHRFKLFAKLQEKQCQFRKNL